MGTLIEECRHSTLGCDLDLTFDIDKVTLTFKIMCGLYLRNCKV